MEMRNSIETNKQRQNTQFQKKNNTRIANGNENKIKRKNDYTRF